MRIKVNETFLDDRRRFEAGDTVTVTDEDGARFVANGWAAQDDTEASGVVSPGSTDLSVRGSKLGVNDTQGA